LLLFVHKKKALLAWAYFGGGGWGEVMGFARALPILVI
jgi:hypothetical protein